MREYLEKKTIKQALKPTYTYLILTDLLLALILIGIMTNIINMQTVVYPLFFLVILIGGAMFELEKLDKSTSLGLKYKWQDYISGKIPSKYIIIFEILSIIIGIIFTHLHYFVIGGFFCGLGSATIVYQVINRKMSKHSNKRNRQ